MFRSLGGIELVSSGENRSAASELFLVCLRHLSAIFVVH